MKTLVWYCKSKKSTGKPIHVKQVHNGTIMEDYYTNKFIFKPRVDQYISIVFNNARGEAKRQGATTVMEVLECPNYDLMKEMSELKKGIKVTSNLGKKKVYRKRK